MNKFFTLLLLVLGISSASSVLAQPLASGYYRLQNLGSNRYGFICDNTGSIDFVNIAIEAGAIELWRDREYVSDPASVVYFKSEGAKNVDASHTVQSYDLISQGTSVREILNNGAVHVAIKATGSSFYIFGAATKAGVYQEKILDDEIAKGPSDPNHAKYAEYDRGYVGLNKGGDYQKWNCHPIDASGDNYFGVKPQLQANGKHYQPFYAAFPFKAYSSGVKIYAVTKVDKAAGVAVISELQGDVPEAYPVIVETSSADPSSNRLDLLASASNSAPSNALSGVYFNNEERNNRKVYDPSTMRLLSVNAQGKLVFAKASVAYLPANQSYLQVDADAPAELVVMTEEEYNSQNVPVSAISLNSTSQTLNIGDTFQLVATVSPEDASDNTLTWTSSNTSVATVDANGLVTAISAGQAVITAKANDASGKSASCTITVEKAAVLVSEIVLDQTEAELEVGKTLQLSASVLPADADDSTVTWSTSDATLATVSASGLVEALAVGEVVITATANDESGVSASCTITIKPDSGIEGVRVDSMGAADIYTLSGVKVRLAGETLEGLTPGLYIVGGNKVIIY